MGDFLSLVSHELRTPLTAIQTYLGSVEARDGGGRAGAEADARVDRSLARAPGEPHRIAARAHADRESGGSCSRTRSATRSKFTEHDAIQIAVECRDGAHRFVIEGSSSSERQPSASP